MEIMRPFNHELNKKELIYLTAGLGKGGIVVNETYYAELGDYLKLKVRLYYENWDTQPATGIIVEIINPGIGIVDTQHFNFSSFWHGESSSRAYWLRKDGWGREPTDKQRDTLADEIRNFVKFYMKGV